MADYQAARALTGKGRNAGRSGRAFKEQRKEGATEVRGEEGEIKEVTMAMLSAEGEHDKASPQAGAANPTLASQMLTV